mmetsp:Transcript_30471/g.84054  ORF Transcript_30471/g.84054 Transcript_30471/m.84054 type:complete len:229 (+) Transcript_30471:914-1600(+)
MPRCKGNTIPQCVHPRELRRQTAAINKSVRRVNANTETRATLVPIDDLLGRIKQHATAAKSLTGSLCILANCMEVPQRCINGVVMSFCFVLIVKPVGHHAFAHKACKCFEAGPRFLETPSCKHQAWQRDHCVATPISKPWVARNDRHQLTPCNNTSDQEIIRCSDQGLEAQCERLAANGLGCTNTYACKVILPVPALWELKVRLIRCKCKGKGRLRLSREALKPEDPG